MSFKDFFYNDILYQECCDEQIKVYPYLHSYIPCSNCIWHQYVSRKKKYDCINPKGFTYTHIIGQGVKK